VPLLLKARLGITEQNVGFFVMYLGGMGVIIRALILGRVVDWLGEGRLSRVGLVLLGGGIAWLIALLGSEVLISVAGLAGLYLMRGWSAGLVPGANADLARLARCRAA